MQKKDLLTSLLLDLLFISIVFQLPVMKSMTLSELSNRTDELSQPDKLMEDEEYKYDLSPPPPPHLCHYDTCRDLTIAFSVTPTAFDESEALPGRTCALSGIGKELSRNWSRDISAGVTDSF